MIIVKLKDVVIGILDKWHISKKKYIKPVYEIEPEIDTTKYLKGKE